MSTMIKSEIVAIAYGAVVKQIFKLSKRNADANKKLFDIGEEIGLRVADEFGERETNSYKPDEVATTFLKGAIREYMGCEIIVNGSEISYMKNRFMIKFRVSLRENPLCDFVILGKNQMKDENGQGLNYHSIIMGFVSGCMKSMAYHPTLTLVSDSLASEGVGDVGSSLLFAGKTETVFDVEMWKDKEED